jgi:dUTP pyrophosphatase
VPETADLEIAVRRLDPDLALPAYAHPGDAGADLVTTVDVTLAPGERALVPTGIAIALPEGYVALVHPRSGLAARHGLSIVNTPGTVDAGYRGEIKVLLINHDPVEPISLKRGDRVAQLVIQRFERARFVAVDDLPDTERGAGGYGSTGVGAHRTPPAGGDTMETTKTMATMETKATKGTS